MAKEDLIHYVFVGTAAMVETPRYVVFAVSTDEINGVLKLLAEDYWKEDT